MEEFKIKSDDELLAEVRKDLEKELKKIPKDVREKEEEELSKKPEFVPDNAIKFIKSETEKIKNFSDSEYADWLCDQHHQYVEALNYSYKQNWLAGDSQEDKYMILLYMNNLFIFLSMKEIEHIRKEVVDELARRNEPELLSILHTLGYF